MKFIAGWLCLFTLLNRLHADVVSLTVSSTASATVGNPGTSQIISNQIAIQTNVTAQILHLHEFTSGNGTYAGGGRLIIQVNGLNFNYTESAINSAGNNMPFVNGPAIIILTSQVSVSTTVGSANAQDNMICTISTGPNIQCNTNLFTPNTGVVIPADSGGPVNIILESSVDLINWTPADPGTYGTSTTNRFFRVRATR